MLLHCVSVRCCVTARPSSWQRPQRRARPTARVCTPTSGLPCGAAVWRRPAAVQRGQADGLRAGCVERLQGPHPPVRPQRDGPGAFAPRCAAQVPAPSPGSSPACHTPASSHVRTAMSYAVLQHCTGAPADVQFPRSLRMQEAAAACGPDRHAGGVDPGPGGQLVGLGVLGRCIWHRRTGSCRAAQAEPHRTLPQCNDAAGEPMAWRHVPWSFIVHRDSRRQQL